MVVDGARSSAGLLNITVFADGEGEFVPAMPEMTSEVLILRFFGSRSSIQDDVVS